MDSRTKDTIGEAQLLSLLAALKVEETPEANFEERFLHDFHNRVVRETVCCPAHLRAWEHILQYLTNFGKKRLLFGASTLGVGVIAMGMVIVPIPDDNADTRVLVAKRFDDTVSSLVPGLARDCNDCTSIRVREDMRDFSQPDLLSSTNSEQSRLLMPDFFKLETTNYPESDFLMSH